MVNNKDSLTSKEWGKIYNPQNIQKIINELNKGQLSFQTREMEKLTKEGQSVLEIGCGSGATSVYLAQHKRITTVMDFSKEALECAEGIANEAGVMIKTILADATEILPFEENAFDVIFQAGLLEHFEKEERIRLLKQWGIVGKQMVSIIPNAASIAYRTGKTMMENKGTWEYGKELPQYSMKNEFQEAGFNVIEEYTIGEEHALEFLPPRHYLRKALVRWMKENKSFDNCGQGYLLVTIGEKRK